ncbi:MAG: ATP-binding cassette domain-containing protein [Bacteroidota bacterium]|nr:ATP-binding cassette domain-containing protein [Bacteroidota bacterium]
MIKTTNISKNFGEIKAVNDITLNIDKGEFYGLLGPNGAGKTTTINLITVYYIPIREMY